MNSILQDQIIEAEERFRQAQLNSDIRLLDELIAPELFFTGHLGQIVRKEDDLAFHRAGVLRLKVLEPVEQHIQPHPGFAVVSVLMHLVGTYEDAPIDQHMRYTRVWAVSGDGALRVIAGHMSEVKAA